MSAVRLWWLSRCVPACRAVLGAAVVLAALPAAAPTSTPPSSAAEYRINAGDDLEVFVWGEERMQRPVKVLPDGTFAFPLAGTITAEGRTAREIGSDIRARLKDQYRAGPPDVTVAVRDTAGMRFYVVGKVRAPGSFATGRTVNVVQALSLAGGPAEFADVDNAIIVRQSQRGQTVERVKLSDVLRGSRGMKPGLQDNPLPMLRSGDVLVVP